MNAFVARDQGRLHRPSVSIAAQALSEVLPTIARQKTDKGGFMVLRPDSGDPVEAVLMGLSAGEKVFGVDTNALGFKVPRGAP
jgi:nicotinamide phosphoribosyltransferase